MHIRVWQSFLILDFSLIILILLLLPTNEYRAYGQQQNVTELPIILSSNSTLSDFNDIERAVNSTIGNPNFELTLRTVDGVGTDGNESSTKPAVYLATNRPNYIVGQPVQIYTGVFDGTSGQGQSDINIQAKYKNETVYSSSTLIPTNKIKILNGPNIDSDGTYNISAKTASGEINQTAWITIKVTSLFTSVPAFFVYMGIAFFGGLTILIVRGTNSHSISEIIRFICITGIVFSVLGGLLLTDLQIGPNSPVGLIIRNISPTNQTGETFADWALNVGGSDITEFSHGISIPIYVVVFGIIGGYLRYLYKTARLGWVYSPLRNIPLFRWEKVPGQDSSIVRTFLKDRFDLGWITSQEFTKSEDGKTLTLSNDSMAVSIKLDENYAKVNLGDLEIYHLIVNKANGKTVYQTMSWRSWVFYQSLEDLALLFLAPLLAIAVWFLLVLAGTESKYTLALASLTIGLVTDEAIRALLKFIRRILGTVQQGQRDPVTESAA